jgi:hypothetical protein
MVAQGWEDSGGLAVVVSDRRNDADSPGMSSVTRVLSLFLATKSRSQTDWQSGGSEHDLVARQFERVWHGQRRTSTTANRAVIRATTTMTVASGRFALLHPA